MSCVDSHPETAYAYANMVAGLKSKDRVDIMFRAFSDRTRLRVLNMLRSGETCVCALQRVLDVPQPKVSRPLAYLKRAGLVTARKDGYWMHYPLAPATSEFHTSL